jgi:hypothetical protein
MIVDAKDCWYDGRRGCRGRWLPAMEKASKRISEILGE